jgi:hypothetical protein
VLQTFPEGEPPKNFKQLLHQAPLFCFPDSFSFPRKHMSTEEKFFSFIVTDLAGYKRCVRFLTRSLLTARYGFCFRSFEASTLELATTPQWPTAYCIISGYQYTTVFEAFLPLLRKHKDSVLFMTYAAVGGVEEMLFEK